MLDYGIFSAFFLLNRRTHDLPGNGSQLLENFSNSLYIRAVKAWVRFIIVFIAYGVALLHTAVPHHHDDIPAGPVVLSHAGCVLPHSTGSFLQIVFSTDLGFGHLEIFKKGADTDIEVSVAPVSFVATFIPKALLAFSPGLSGDSLDVFIDKLKKRLLLFSNAHFRAPPIFF